MRIRRFRKLLGLSLVLGCLLCSWSSALARGLQEVIESGELRACVVPISPAYVRFAAESCLEDCEASGSVPRVVEAFARSLGPGVRPVFHRVQWGEQFQNDQGLTDLAAEYTPRLLASGKCDIYPSHLTRNEWRQKKMEFAILFSSRMMVLVHKDRVGDFQSLEDLGGKSASVDINTSFHTWLEEQNRETFKDNPVRLQVVTVGDENIVVQTGEADFTLQDADVSLWEIANRMQDLRVAFPVGPVDYIGWGLRKEDVDLRDAAQSFFDTQLQDETSELNRIWKEEYGLTLSQLQLLIQATQ